MLNIKIRQGWDRLMRPVGRAIARAHVTPNQVTLLGFVLQVAVAVMILEGKLLVAGLIAVVAAVADAVDGAVAKAERMTSAFGAFLDSSLDRASDALYFVPVAWLYGVQPDVPSRGSLIVCALALATLVFSFLVSYLKARAESLGFDCNVGIAERAERLIIVILGLLFDQLLIALSLLLLLSVVTFFQRLLHVLGQHRSA